ncbi:hypothetical protein H6P81_001674 [Aristolochia fimbriata]|uniref:Uncharacterized protein n=1 Tax=Aristolochia fimbriata TaxID=158543 RepID=A0AAV7FAS3_ARIFI|nr:hypothetical protein H6P81_001674 [Aristolochia fimbriata]
MGPSARTCSSQQLDVRGEWKMEKPRIENYSAREQIPLKLQKNGRARKRGTWRKHTSLIFSQTLRRETMDGDVYGSSGNVDRNGDGGDGPKLEAGGHS